MNQVHNKSYIVFDIETIPAPVPQAYIDRAMSKFKEDEYKPLKLDLSKYKQEETRERHALAYAQNEADRLEKHKKEQAKRRKKFENTVISNFKWRPGGMLIKSMSACEADPDTLTISNLESFAHEDTREVLLWFNEYLEEYPGQINFVTYNGDRFDIPHVHWNYAYHKLELPYRIGKWDSIDLMKLVNEWGEKYPYTLDLACLIYGVTDSIPETDGSMVEAMVASGEWERLAEYNKADVEKTAKLFLALARTKYFG